MSYRDMPTVNIDVETYSSYPLTGGVHRYAEAPDFEIQLITYYNPFDDDYVTLDMTNSGVVSSEDVYTTEDYRTFRDLLRDPGTMKSGFNCPFERTTLRRFIGEEMPAEQWRDTMAEAYLCGLSGGLLDVGRRLGLPEELLKDTAGKALIRKFAVLQKPTKSNGGRTRILPQDAPEDYRRYAAYNRQDVVTERAVMQVLDTFDIPDAEHDLWVVDQQINDTGVLIDRDLVEHAITLDAANTAALSARFEDLTGGLSATQRGAVLEWINANYDIDLKDLRAATVAATLRRDDLPDDLREILELRSVLAKTSGSKYQRMIDCVSSGDRLRGLFQFAGANRTGRWAGRRVQPQNLPRIYMDAQGLADARDLLKAGRYDAMEAIYE